MTGAAPRAAAHLESARAGSGPDEKHGDRRSARLSALRSELTSAGLDALLVTHAPNVQYLTGFSGSSGLLLVAHDAAFLVTDFRYRTQAREQVSGVAEVQIGETSLWSRLWTTLPRLAAVRTVGFDSANVSHADYQRFAEAGAPWRWQSTSGLVESLRQRKDAGEVAHIRTAIAIAESALHATVPAIRAGMTEFEVAAILECALRQRGSEAHPFEAIVASGERSALPHARSSARRLRPGEFLVLDFGATSGGYCADITRTFVVGKATQSHHDTYDVVREANATACLGVVAGMRGCDADAIAREHIAGCGLGAEFGHSLGHGIGIEVHEKPLLARTADAPLPVDSVVTIEPGVYREGWGGVRIEDDVHLGLGRTEVLTVFPRELIEVG
ncbi:MAG: aminopeptidase P family protein [Gemmatimonadaceae bacterium]|nr:aminopeptidase P family protein [Gemmatimonadaceae bacterium]